MRVSLKLLSVLSAIFALAASTAAHATSIGIELTENSLFGPTLNPGNMYLGTFESSTYDATPGGMFAVDSFSVNAIDRDNNPLVFDSGAGAVVDVGTGATIPIDALKIVNGLDGKPSHLVGDGTGAFPAFVNLTIPISCSLSSPCQIGDTGWHLGLNAINGQPGTFTLFDFEMTGLNGFVPVISSVGTYAMGTYELSLAGSEVPLPAALPLFASGLGVTGLLAWRRKRKNAATATA